MFDSWIPESVRRLNWTWLLLDLIGLVVVLNLVGVAILFVLVIRLPANYFLHDEPPPFMHGNHPLLRGAGFIAKNVIGAVLLVAGAIMILPGVPGPGLMAIVWGIVLIDFPGKRRLEMRLIRKPSILASVNRMRGWANHGPLIVDKAEDSSRPLPPD